jgi:hypothetical protein
MGNLPHAYKDRDIKRVIKAARDAGIDPSGVRVNPKTGEITVIGRSTSALEPKNDLDRELEKFEAHHG